MRMPHLHGDLVACHSSNLTDKQQGHRHKQEEVLTVGMDASGAGFVNHTYS